MHSEHTQQIRGNAGNKTTPNEKVRIVATNILHGSLNPHT